MPNRSTGVQSKEPEGNSRGSGALLTANDVSNVPNPFTKYFKRSCRNAIAKFILCQEMRSSSRMGYCQQCQTARTGSKGKNICRNAASLSIKCSNQAVVHGFCKLCHSQEQKENTSPISCKNIDNPKVGCSGYVSRYPMRYCNACSEKMCLTGPNKKSAIKTLCRNSAAIVQPCDRIKAHGIDGYCMQCTKELVPKAIWGQWRKKKGSEEAPRLEGADVLSIGWRKDGKSGLEDINNMAPGFGDTFVGGLGQLQDMISGKLLPKKAMKKQLENEEDEPPRKKQRVSGSFSNGGGNRGGHGDDADDYDDDEDADGEEEELEDEEEEEEEGNAAQVEAEKSLRACDSQQF